MRVIQLKKPFGMWRVTKVWDSEQQSGVQGGAVLPVVAREAAHRHPMPVAAMDTYCIMVDRRQRHAVAGRGYKSPTCVVD